MAPGALRTHLLGRDPLDVEGLWRAMWQGWPGQYGRGSEGGLAANAMGALDIALWDLAGKLRGEPVWKLLGGRVQDRVMAYASGSMFVSSSYEGGGEGPWLQKSPDALRREAAGEVAAGFRAMKFGWGTHFEPEDRERLRASATGAGPEARVMVDVGCCPGYRTPGWDSRRGDPGRSNARGDRRLLHGGADAAARRRGHARVRAGTRTRVATGESLTAVHEFERFIEREGALDRAARCRPDGDHPGRRGRPGRRCRRGCCAPRTARGRPCSWRRIVAIQVTIQGGVLVEYPALATYDRGSRAGEISAADELRAGRPSAADGRDGYLVPSDRPGLGLGGFVPATLERLRALAE